MAEEPCNSPRMGSGIEDEIRRIVDERLREVPSDPGFGEKDRIIAELENSLQEAEREYCQEMKRANDRIKELEKALAFNPK